MGICFYLHICTCRRPKKHIPLRVASLGWAVNLARCWASDLAGPGNSAWNFAPGRRSALRDSPIDIPRKPPGWARTVDGPWSGDFASPDFDLELQSRTQTSHAPLPIKAPDMNLGPSSKPKHNTSYLAGSRAGVISAPLLGKWRMEVSTTRICVL